MSSDGKIRREPWQLWLVAITCELLLSLLAFLGTVIADFFYFTATSTPLWVTVLSGVSIFGIALGFGGLFLLLAVAGVKSWRSEKRRADARG